MKGKARDRYMGGQENADMNERKKKIYKQP